MEAFAASSFPAKHMVCLVICGREKSSGMSRPHITLSDQQFFFTERTTRQGQLSLFSYYHERGSSMNRLWCQTAEEWENPIYIQRVRKKVPRWDFSLSLASQRTWRKYICNMRYWNISCVQDIFEKSSSVIQNVMLEPSSKMKFKQVILYILKISTKCGVAPQSFCENQNSVQDQDLDQEVAVRLYIHQFCTRITLHKNSTPNDFTRGQLYTK